MLWKFQTRVGINNTVIDSFGWPQSHQLISSALLKASNRLLMLMRIV
jgi:hypothetical protein